jgi:hypothetical protein
MLLRGCVYYLKKRIASRYGRSGRGATPSGSRGCGVVARGPASGGVARKPEPLDSAGARQ